MRIRDRISLEWAKIRFPLSQFGNWLLAVIGAIGGIVAFVQAVGASTSVREWVESLGLVTIARVSLVAWASREVKLSKAARLAKALRPLEEAADKLRDLSNFLRTNAENMQNGQGIRETILRDSRNVVEDVSTIYANMYSVLTSSPCRMCLKLLDISHTAGSNPVTLETTLFALARDRLPQTGFTIKNV